MNVEKEDLRVFKTKNALKNALLELLIKQPFEEIKIIDICKAAYVNRSTFYFHYSSKYDLLEETIKVYKDDLFVGLQKNDKLDEIDIFKEMIRLYITHISANKERFLPIIVNNRNGVFLPVVFDTLKKDISNRVNINKINKDGISYSICIDFYLNAVVLTSIDWLLNPKGISKEELIDNMCNLIKNGL